MNRKTGFWIAVWLVLVVASGMLVFGSGYGHRGYGSWHGWGQMDGWHHGYNSEGAPDWYGMEPSMMGDIDSGYGWGMMDQFHGMAGVGYGMMLWLQQNMTEEQVNKVGSLLEDVGKNTRKLMQQRLDAQTKLNRLFTSDKRDWNAIRAAVDELAELNSRQMKAAVEMQQKIDGLLTDKQREEMSQTLRGDSWHQGR